MAVHSDISEHLHVPLWDALGYSTTSDSYSMYWDGLGSPGSISVKGHTGPLLHGSNQRRYDVCHEVLTQHAFFSIDLDTKMAR